MTTCVGLDLSLTATGIARASDHSSDTGYGWANVTTLATWLLETETAGDAIPARADRLTDLAAAIVARVTETPVDLVCIERPAYSSASGSAPDRAGLWWLVVARLVRGHRLPVVDVVNNHLKMYAVGSGRASKDMVLAAAVRRYGHMVPTLDNNNEADALHLAALGLHRLTGRPLVELPQTHHRALAAVKWPANVPAGTN